MLIGCPKQPRSIPSESAATARPDAQTSRAESPLSCQAYAWHAYASTQDSLTAPIHRAAEGADEVVAGRPPPGIDRLLEGVRLEEPPATFAADCLSTITALFIATSSPGSASPTRRSPWW